MSQHEHQRAEEIKTPFSFKLMVVLAVLYLGWRLVQGIVWLFQWITG
jgi:hypothetical protein